MALNPVAPNLDPSDFVVVPHVCAIDEFRMTNPDGSFVADVTPVFLNRLCAHMQEREDATGDLAPIVIGHTMDGLPEVEQPPVVGFARNWSIGELGSTGRKAAFFDAWIRKDRVEQVRNYPRRSCEVWASRYEVDPISLLGATTPARDLGLMKLSRDGSQIVNSPGDMNMPEDKDKKDKPEDKKDKKPDDGKKDMPKADPKETGEAKGIEGKLDQILSLLTQLTEGSAVAGGAAPAPTTPGAPPAGGQDGEMSDDDYNKLMAELMGGEGAAGAKPEDSRAGEKPTPNEGGASYPNQSDTVVPGQEKKAKMSREEQRIADLEAQVTRMQIKDRLIKLARPDVANPEDAQFVEDLVCMAPEVRERALVRLSRVPAAPGQSTGLLQGALENANANAGKRMTQADAVRLSRIASDRNAKGEKVSFEQVAAEHGFDLRAQ